MGVESKTLRDVMTQPVMTIRVDVPVCEAAQKMAISRSGCVLVVDDDQHLVGVFTERDLVRMFTTRLQPPLDEPVAEHMSRYPLTLEANASVEQGRSFMVDNLIRHLPVVEEGRLVGLVTIRDIARAETRATRF